MIQSPDEVLAEISALGSCSLALEFLFVSHASLTLRLSSEGVEDAFLSFAFVESFDLPMLLSNVRLGCSVDRAKRLLSFELVGAEGVFFIHAEYVWYLKGGEFAKMTEFIRHTNSLPIWENGISVADLADLDFE